MQPLGRKIPRLVCSGSGNRRVPDCGRRGLVALSSSTPKTGHGVLAVHGHFYTSDSKPSVKLPKFTMTPKSKKPSLPRLSTDISSENLSSASIPLQAKRPQEVNAQPRPEQPVTVASSYLMREENMMPTVNLGYSPEAKPFWVAEDIERAVVRKDKMKYYEDIFTARGPHNTAQDRVAQDSVVIAELKTNCKPKDEQKKLVADLLFHLAQIYKRPESSIMVTLQQECGVFFGNTNEPSYLLKIYALPSFIAPITNIRNTNLIQAVILDILHIQFSQGVVIYIPIPEDNLATNGSTARSEISRLERNDSDDSPSIFKSISRTMSRRLKMGSGHTAPVSQPSAVVSPESVQTQIILTPTTSGKLDEPNKTEDKEQVIRKRDSVRSFVRRRVGELLETKKREMDEREEAKKKKKDDDDSKKE